MRFIKKYWFIIAILLISIMRFAFTFNLPNFYIQGMKYDDVLMIKQLNYVFDGKYLGKYNDLTLIKGTLFPVLLFIIRIYRISYSNGFTILYILSSIYFIYALKNVIKNKKVLIIIYALLLFNPAAYSQDLFQRLYRNSISMTEFIFFLGSFINILFNKKERIYHYLLFGLSLSFLFLTRDDNLWTYPIILFVIIYKIIKNRSIKTIIMSVIPVLILCITLNVISCINYNYYGIYTYNEIQKSEFHNTYKKILQIKDDEKIHEVSIPKSTLYKLADYSSKFQITREEIDDYYNKYYMQEMNNGNIIWGLRELVYTKFKFKSGKESEQYYKELGIELDKLFEEGKLEKEFVMPSTYMAVPTKEDIVDTFKNCFYAVGYTSSYSDIKTLVKVDEFLYMPFENAYTFVYIDYHHTVNIVDKNELRFELVRVFFKYTTIVLGVLSICIYLKNIFKLDNIEILSHLLLIMYLLIIGGVAYTHTTSFHAIRPIYLGNIYIIQTIFILINIYRLYTKSIRVNIRRT